MKKVMIVLGIIAVFIIGGVVLLVTNLDKLVATAIETAGTRAVGSEVSVGSVELDLLSGSASIFDFSIANPNGYSDGNMASFSELSVRLDVQNMDANNVHITSVVARDPYVRYESINGTSNFDTVSARFDDGSGGGQASSGGGAQPFIRIDSVVIENIRGSLQSDRLPAAVEVTLGDIQLSNLEGYPDELASQVLEPVLSQLGRRAAQALLEAGAEILSNTEGLRDRLDDVSERAEEALDRVGNLFRRDEE